MKNIFFITCLFFSGNLLAQNINGAWLGEIYMKNKEGKYTLLFPVSFDLSTDSITKKITGVSTTKSFDTLVSECLVTCNYNSEKEIYTITETKTTYANKLKDGLPFNVLNRFYVSISKNSEALMGTVDCITPEHSPLCHEKLKIELRRFVPDK